MYIKCFASWLSGPRDKKVEQMMSTAQYFFGEYLQNGEIFETSKNVSELPSSP